MYPRGHWLDIQNHIVYANQLATQNGWTTPQDWNSISQRHFKESGGGGLLGGSYGGSPWQFILNIVAQFIYPNHLWLEWKIGCQAPNGFWKDPEKVRFCLDVLASKEGFSSLDSFYTVSQDTYKIHHITSIQNKFGSQLNMLKLAYPEKAWKEYKFKCVTRGYWESHANVVVAVKDMESEEAILQPSGWYMHTVATVNRHCGDGLIANKYGGSLFKMLKDIYPEYQWKGYIFVKAPHQYWLDDANCREWLSDYMAARGYSAPQDLYNTRYESLIEFPGARGIIDRFGGYINTFVYLYPELDRVAFYKAGVSKIANEYLTYMEGQLGPLEREFRIPGTRWHADGYHRETNTVIEFNGDYWHGNPSKYAPEDIHPVTLLRYGEMHRQTIERLDAIRKMGFKLLEIWEDDWKRQVRARLKSGLTAAVLDSM